MIMMRQTLESRALFTLSGSNVDLHGTYHMPTDSVAETDLQATASGRIGILFVNALSTPRAGFADSAVHWAESFAACGYPSFRVDLPGLGDTFGAIPMELLTFITQGGYANIAIEKIKELIDRFSLAGIVIVGHCAGAVTALFAASELNVCKGLILMDPYFDFAKRVAAHAPEIVSWSRRSRLGEVLRDTYGLARELPRALRKDRLPPSANPALLEHWRHVASRGVPILVFRSPGKQPRKGQFDYMEHAVTLAGRKARIEIRLIADADHSFANRGGRNGVRKHAEAWLNEYFPRTQ
jgi:pimeloyl-ACP methyl ester carboxylesterase